MMRNDQEEEEEGNKRYSTNASCQEDEPSRSLEGEGEDSSDGSCGTTHQQLSSLPPPPPVESISFAQEEPLLQEGSLTRTPPPTLLETTTSSDYWNDGSSQFLMQVVASRATRDNTSRATRDNNNNNSNNQQTAKGLTKRSPPPQTPNSSGHPHEEKTPPSLQPPPSPTTRPGAVHVPGINSSTNDPTNSGGGGVATAKPEDDGDHDNKYEGYWGSSSHHHHNRDSSNDRRSHTTTPTPLPPSPDSRIHNYPKSDSYETAPSSSAPATTSVDAPLTPAPFVSSQPAAPIAAGSVVVDHHHHHHHHHHVDPSSSSFSSTSLRDSNHHHSSSTTNTTHENNNNGAEGYGRRVPFVPIGIPLVENRNSHRNLGGGDPAATATSTNHHHHHHQEQAYNNFPAPPAPPGTTIVRDGDGMIATVPPPPPPPLRPSATPVVTAFAVNDQDLEGDIRRRIIEEAVSAQIVLSIRETTTTTTTTTTAAAATNSEENNGETPQPVASKREQSTGSTTVSNNKRKRAFLCCIAIIIAAVAVVVGLMLSASSSQEQQKEQELKEEISSSKSSTTTNNNNQRPTIELIRERGYLLCGLYAGKPGFSLLQRDTGEIVGINIDQCGALALALLGDPNLVEHVVVTSQTRLPMLANGSIDILSSTATHTMGRDVYDAPSVAGFSFSAPYLYTGMNFVGDPTFVNCAENLDTFYGTCRQLRVCAGLGTTHHYNILKILPGSAVVATSSQQEQADFLIDGTCNVIATEPAALPESLLRGYGYKGPFRQGTNLFTKEPLTLVTRQNDPEWSSLVDLLVNIFYIAESQNISKTNAERLRDLFLVDDGDRSPNHDDDDNDMAEIAVSVVSQYGNYGDLYDQHLKDLIPREGLNQLYDYKSGTTTGLLYSHPFGNLEPEGPGPTGNSTLQRILDRGYLRCGVIPRPGFAAAAAQTTTTTTTASNNRSSATTKWYGFDVEFCRGLAGSIFHGKSDKIEIINVTTTKQDSGGAYMALLDGLVDTVAGLRVTLQAGYREPTTGKSFAFSPPTYYSHHHNGDGTAATEAFAFATTKEDYQWSDLVYWVISGLVYAEENGITKETSVKMPVITLFGNQLKQMLRDAVHSVGSYSEIYNRTLGNADTTATMPGMLPMTRRSGGNLLNGMSSSGPQQFPLPIS